MTGAASDRHVGGTLRFVFAPAAEPCADRIHTTRAPEQRANLRAPGPLAPGARLLGTPFTVVRLLGQGGMGEVYEVEHVALGRRFAVKLLHRNHSDRADLAARMRAEARALGRLRHRSLPAVFDLGMTGDGRTYFAMELLEGRDLRTELGRLHVMAVPTALALEVQALSALSAAHAAGIVHRDIKLENLFLCDDGTLKLLDFGVAKLLHDGAALTAPDALIGTPRMMAPEQCAAARVDARADIYAAGLVLYELVAGRGPFDELRGQREALRFAHCEREPPPPSHFAPQPVPAAVEQLILRAIAKAPEQRFQSAGEMEAAVRCLLESGCDRVARAVPSAFEPTEVDAGLVAEGAARRSGAPSMDAGLVAEGAARRPGAPSMDAGLVAEGAARRSRAPSMDAGLVAEGAARRPGAPRMGALRVGAVAFASAMLGLALAQRLPAPAAAAGPRASAPLPAGEVASQLRGPVR